MRGDIKSDIHNTYSLDNTQMHLGTIIVISIFVFNLDK